MLVPFVVFVVGVKSKFTEEVSVDVSDKDDIDALWLLSIEESVFVARPTNESLKSDKISLMENAYADDEITTNKIINITTLFM